MKRPAALLAAACVLAALVLLAVFLIGGRDQVPVGLEPRPAESARASRPAAEMEVVRPDAPSPGSGTAPGPAPIDPRLARIRVELEPSDGPTPATAARPQQSEAKAMVERIVGGLGPDGKDGTAFGFRGEMAVVYPAPVGSPDKKRATFGAGEEVTSRFTRVQDERGNFCMHEESHSKHGNTKYDGPAYNGDWCLVDGRYGHVDLSNHRATEAETNAIVQERRGARVDPLVIRTIRELLQENEPLIAFESVTGGQDEAGGERYGIAPLPPEKRDSPTGVKRLAGDVRFVSQGGALAAVAFSGELVLGSGYMKGAPITFATRVEAIPQDQLQPVRLP